MKYRTTGILAALCMMTGIFALSQVETDNPDVRVHQHMQAVPSECGCDGSQLCTHLPLVVIETGGREIPGAVVGDIPQWSMLKDETDQADVAARKLPGAERVQENESTQIQEDNYEGEKYTTTEEGSDMLSVHVSIMDDPDKKHHPDDDPDVESTALIRIRGNTSRRFDKKNYLLRFTDQDGQYQEEEVMGMDAHYEWALHGPYLDKSLIRNYLWYNIAGEIMDYAPNVRFCEVILDGTYIGVYLMTETITNGVDSRLNISEPVENTTETGYLLRLDRYTEDQLRNLDNFTAYTFKNTDQVEIRYPRSGSLTPKMQRAIEQEFSDFEKALYSFDYDTDDYGYWHNIDTGSFVDYWILNEFTSNTDAGRYSTYLYKDIGGRYKMVIWDFNSACDNYQAEETSPYTFSMQDDLWYQMLMRDEDFTERIIDRYRKLRKTWLSDEYLEQYIDETLEYLGDAIDRNFSVWDYTFELPLLRPESRNIRSHEEAVAQLKEYIQLRGQWLDENIETIQQYSHASKNKRYNH